MRRRGGKKQSDKPHLVHAEARAAFCDFMEADALRTFVCVCACPAFYTLREAGGLPLGTLTLARPHHKADLYPLLG